jgi:hypothetical protein
MTYFTLSKVEKGNAIPKQLEKLGIQQEGSSEFLLGASDHCREARRERE